MAAETPPRGTDRRTRRTKPAAERRADLLEAAERLFLAQGVEATSIEQIAEAAGVAKGSFYLQFESREELLAALRRGFLDDYREELEAVLAGVPAEQHAARLAVWTAVTLAALVERSARRSLLFGRLADWSLPGGPDPIARLAALLEAGVRAGAWRLAEPQSAAAFLFHGLLGLLERGPRQREALEESAMALVERLVLAVE